MLCLHQSHRMFSAVQAALTENNKMTDFGELSWRLDVQVTRCRDSVRRTQMTYVIHMLEKRGMEEDSC